jgi:hypothetical protein
MLRLTEAGVHETGMLQVLVLGRIRGRYSTVRHGHGHGAHFWHGGRRADRSARSPAAVPAAGPGVIMSAQGPEPEPRRRLYRISDIRAFFHTNTVPPHPVQPARHRPTSTCVSPAPGDLRCEGAQLGVLVTRGHLQRVCDHVQLRLSNHHACCRQLILVGITETDRAILG